MFAIHETLNESLGNLRAISNGEIKKVIETAVKKNIGNIGPNSKVIEVSGIGWKNFVKDLKKAGNESFDEKTFSLFALLIDGVVEIFVNEDPSAAVGLRTKIKNVSGRDAAAKIGDLEFFEDTDYRAVFVYADENRQEVRDARAANRVDSLKREDRYEPYTTRKEADSDTFSPGAGKSQFYRDALGDANRRRLGKVNVINLNRITASHLAALITKRIQFSIDGDASGDVYRTWFTMQSSGAEHAVIGTSVVVSGCTRESDGKKFYIAINAPKMKVELIPV